MVGFADEKMVHLEQGRVPPCILHPMHHPHPTSYTECTKEDIIILLSFLHYWNASLSRPSEPMHHFKHRLIPASPLADTSYHFINQPPPTIRTEKSAPGSDTLGCVHEFNLHSLFVAISDLLLQLNFMIAFRYLLAAAESVKLANEKMGKFLPPAWAAAFIDMCGNVHRENVQWRDIHWGVRQCAE